MDLFKGEMTFVREYSGVAKSARGIKFAGEAKAVPYVKRGTFLFQKEKERALRPEVTVWKDDLFGLDQKLSALLRATGDTVNYPLHCDSFGADESGNMRRGMVWVKIEMDGENSESQEEQGRNAGAPARSLQDLQEGPDSKEDQKSKDQIGREIGEVEMAEINS